MNNQLFLLKIERIFTTKVPTRQSYNQMGKSFSPRRTRRRKGLIRCRGVWHTPWGRGSGSRIAPKFAQSAQIITASNTTFGKDFFSLRALRVLRGASFPTLLAAAIHLLSPISLFGQEPLRAGTIFSATQAPL